LACHLGDLLAGWFGSSLRRDGGEHASRFFAEVEVQLAKRGERRRASARPARWTCRKYITVVM